MKFCKNLYLGNSIKKKRKKVIWKLKTKASLFDIYVFMIPKDGIALEYCNSSYLKQKYYRRHKPTIYGIARGMEEAEELLLQMTSDSYQNTGKYDVNAYVRSLT